MRATAPGKIILFGEHAVVYGQPAIAVPVRQVEASATVTTGGPGLRIVAEDLDTTLSLQHAAEHALALMAKLVLDELEEGEPDATIRVRSGIPIAGGLGSGAAVSAAVGRVLSQHLGQPLDDARLNALVYETEKIHHGTPSGIDNTVICYNQPVYYVRDETIEPFAIGRPFRILIADTGVPSPTKETVGDVRAGWQKNPARFEALFEAVGDITRKARAAIEGGRIDDLPRLMNDNQAILEEMGVSSPLIRETITAGRSLGAQGAKLSGGGRGGNVIFYAEDYAKLAEGLNATHIIITEVG